MFSYMIERMDGSGENEEVIHFKPSKRYIIGTLASRKEESDSDIYEEEGRASVRA